MIRNRRRASLLLLGRYEVWLNIEERAAHIGVAVPRCVANAGVRTLVFPPANPIGKVLGLEPDGRAVITDRKARAFALKAAPRQRTEKPLLRDYFAHLQAHGPHAILGATLRAAVLFTSRVVARFLRSTAGMRITHA